MISPPKKILASRDLVDCTRPELMTTRRGDYFSAVSREWIATGLEIDSGSRMVSAGRPDETLARTSNELAKLPPIACKPPP